MRRPSTTCGNAFSVLVALFGGAMLLAGCADTDASAQPAPSATVTAPAHCPSPTESSWADPRTSGENDGGAIPDGFKAVAALRCLTPQQLTTGAGAQVTEQRATSGLDAVLAELRRSSDPRTTGPCTAIKRLVPYFVIIDGSGQTIRPAVPVDSCGQPRVSALNAIGALPWQTVSETAQPTGSPS